MVEGAELGATLGTLLGIVEGTELGTKLGAEEGDGEGASDGEEEGTLVITAIDPMVMFPMAVLLATAAVTLSVSSRFSVCLSSTS